jgi:hypothetical protein
MSSVDAVKKGPLRVSYLVLCVASALCAAPARASQPPLLPVAPYDWAPPTPASPPPDPVEFPPGFNMSFPPFDSPLPPAINYPPPIVVPHGTTPPVNCGPFGNECRDDPGPAAPYLLPEQAGNPDVAEPAAGGLRQALAEYDRRLGLGGGGPVVSEARAIAQREFVTGSATFEVLAEPSGRIRTVRLRNASQDRQGWERFAEALHQARVTGMRLPEQAHGVWLVLYVSAENELSTGQTSLWSPGVWLAFDVASVYAQRLRTVESRVLTEVWY